jgi:hypothetical protein
MKKVLLGILLVHIGFYTIAQSLAEIKSLRFYEHHSSTINGGKPFGSGANGSQSGYDFVNHTFYNSFNAANFGPYLNGEESNIDMVEHNGYFVNESNFGFTSGVSSIWGGAIQGNNSSLWVVASGGFNYTSATTVNELKNEYDAGTPGNTINTVQTNSVYISKIRNTNLYVAVKCYNVTNIVGTPSGFQNIYFDFDYKYGTLSEGNLVTSITVQGQGGVSIIASQGGTLQMIESVLPANATDNSVTWSVVNGTGSATISVAGLLTATGDGTVTVTATANDDSGITGSTIITISNQTVGISELGDNNNFIYPNPTTDYITIDAKIKKILIYSLDGKVMLSSHSGYPNEKLNVSSLPSGSYILQMIDFDGKKYTEKMQKH